MKRSAAVLFVLVLVFALGATSYAQTVVADGLNGPMGVLVAPDGAVWVIDSGLGGDQTMEMFTPQTGGMATVALGSSARVVRVDPDGAQDVITQLPSVLVEQEATGGARLALLDGEVYLTSGFWVEFGGPDAPALMGTVLRLGDAGPELVADTWTFERLANPDRFVKESHPYGITAGPDGWLWVADAGANTILRIDPASGRIDRVATLPGVPIPFPNPARGDRMETDPVPTGITVGADGAVYVATLPGFPFTPGSASVLRVDPDGSVVSYAGGLTMLTDLVTGPDGQLYGVQFAVFGEQGPQPASGALLRIDAMGATPVLEGLVFPTSVAFDDAGNAYLTVNGVGAPGSGQVHRYDGIAGN